MTQQVLSSAGAIKESNSFGNAGYGTTLPTSPTDGMEYILVDSVSAPTYQWRLRYNASSAQTDKWEFVGGPPATAHVVTREQINSASYTGLTTAQSITVPRAGQYQLEFGYTYENPASTQHAYYATIKIGAAAASDTNAAINTIRSVAGGLWQSTMSNQYIAACAASDALVMQYRCDSADTATYAGQRFFKVTPIRVS